MYRYNQFCWPPWPQHCEIDKIFMFMRVDIFNATVEVIEVWCSLSYWSSLTGAIFIVWVFGK